MNEYERNARHHSVDPPRVYKLVREKQKKAPVQKDDGKDSVDETIQKLLSKAGNHMEFTLVGQYDCNFYSFDVLTFFLF